jgi:hypothetical protein
MAVYTRADNVASVGTGFEPQRTHNWALELNLDGEENDEITLSVVEGFLPARYNDLLEIPYGNEIVYAAGKMRWESGSVTLRDWVDKRTAKLLLDWQLQVGNPHTGAIGLCTSYKRDASIILFGPNVENGAPEEQVGEKIWTLHGVWPLRVNPGSLDMTNSGQVMIQVALQYDKATGSGSRLDLNYDPVPRQSIVAPVL